MWNKLRQTLGYFPTVDLSWVGDDGYPVSVRISPEPIDGAEVVRFTPPIGLQMRDGPASLLGHSHNEETWNLKEFLVRGHLKQDESGWAFRPLTFIPGMGSGSLLEQIKFTFRLRLTANRYLERRNLSRPVIPWHNIKRSHSGR